MELPMNRFQPLLVDVRINLGRGDIRMPEHLLDDPEIGSVAQKMGRETVPQQVRINVSIQSRMLRMMFHNLPDPHGG